MTRQPIRDVATTPPRELGLRDLILFSTACIVSIRWIPAAAVAGPGSVTLWLLAAVLFVGPLAVAVAALVRKYPGVGGMYLWTRRDFGPWHGFLCFWVYWMGIAFWFPGAAMFYMSAAIHLLGPSYAHLADDRAFLVAVSLAAIWIALGTNLCGMRIGKWTENLGGMASAVLAVIFITLAALIGIRKGSATPLDLVPAMNWDTAGFGATIAYAMSGLEMAGLMAGEIRDPERTVSRAGWIASGFAVIFYTSTTLALLVMAPPAEISALHGLARAAETAGGTLGAGWIPPLIALLVLATAVGQFGGFGSSVSRLPFAAGVDGLLPAAFGRLHPRWQTPHISILALGVVASFLLVVAQLGDTLRAAYQALISLMVIVGFLPYTYIFASAWKAGKRWSAVSGWAVTAVAVLGSVAPTRDVSRVWVFEAKLALGTAAVIASAWLVYRSQSRKRAMTSGSSSPDR